MLKAKNQNQKDSSAKKRKISNHAPKYIHLGTWLQERRFKMRAVYLTLAALIGFGIFSQIVVEMLINKNYEISPQVRAVIGESDGLYGNFLNFDPKTKAYEYNPGYQPISTGAGGQSGRPKFSASFKSSPEDGVRVDDPVSETSVTIKPDFAVAPPRQVENRLMYPIKGQDAVKIYTMQAVGFKEDIVLNSKSKDKLSYTYILDLASGTEARLEADGSVGVYGVSQELLGDVSTGSEADAQLLENARKNASKNTLLYTIPAPYVREYGSKDTKVKTWFSLEGNKLTVHASNLKNASYPLSIDPSVYVDTATKLMRGNNESNIDFDVNNELIQKGSATGARFDSLTSTLSLQNERWNHGTAVAGGYVYVVGGSSGSVNQSDVYFAKFDTDNYDIDTTNPGEGACGDWCTNSAYDLPAPRAGLSLVAYNGFLYAIGGTDSSCTTGNGTGDGGICDTVYIAKLGANGEPSLWHPTDSEPSNWEYWHRAGDISSERRYMSAVAYNNRLYLLGGETDSSGSPAAVDTVEKSEISPTGDLGNWSSSGMTTLSSARFGHSSQVYNTYIYLIGGNSGGTLQNSVEYIKINNDGTMVSSWTDTNAFTTARQSWGGNFSTVWGSYLYVSGGCAAIDAEGECTTTGITDGGSVELASINADGSISNWNTISGVTNSRIGYGFVGWRNTVYTIGGCMAQDTSTGNCTTTSAAARYGTINPDGDVSTVSVTEASGSGNCIGSDPFDCDLAPAGDGAGEIGHMLSSTAIMNGYLYVIGGCTDNSTTTECSAGDGFSGNISYAAISSDGTLHRSPSCVGTYYGSWCVDSTHTVNGTDGVGAAGVAVFEGRIYVVGGLDNTADGTDSVFSVEVNSDGSISDPWDQQDLDDIGLDTTNTGELAYTFAYARANPTSADTFPGNLYIMGGCADIGSGVGCNNDDYRTEVYKCNIEANGLLEEADANDCDTTGQLQIDAELSDETNQGLGLHSGAVYANYIYLVGGASESVSERSSVIFAKFDNNNNIVDAESGAVSGNDDDWILSSSTLADGRHSGSSFGYNGHLYVMGGYDSSGPIDGLEFAKFNVGTGDIESFTTSAESVDGRWGASLIVSNSYAYVIGGCNTGSGPDGCTSFEPSSQVIQIHNNDSGTPGGYTTSTNLFGTDRFGTGAVIYNGFIYVAGGCVDTVDCDDATNSVEYAALNDDGTIGTWSTTTGSLPADRVFGQLEEAGGTLYFIGGRNDGGTAQSTVYYATPGGGGDISSWSTASNGLPAARSQPSAAVWSDRIYVTGGTDATPTQNNTVYISPQLSTGGDIGSSWTSGTAFSVPRSHHTTIAYANNLYVMGGYDGTSLLNDVQFTQINSDGTLDSWTYSTSLPEKIRGIDGFAANGYMYVFGGKHADQKCNNNTYVAPIAANTTVASGNNPTGIGEWFVTNQRYNGERANVSAVYHEGKAYVLGGACGELEAGSTTTVLEDDFDPSTDGADWSTLNRMANGTACGTLSSGNTLYSQGRQGGNIPEAVTVDVDVSFGGTVSFYLRIPTGGGGCDPPEAGEDVQLQYSNNGGIGWVTLATYDESNFNTPTLVQETIPSAAQTESTRFRWIIPNQQGNNQDQFAIDDVVIEASDVPPTAEVLFDDFDPSTDGLNWISTTGMNNDTTCGTISSGNNLNSSGGSSNAVSTDVDLRYGGTVSFYLRLPTNSGGGCTQLGTGEDLLVQYSTDSGSNWSTFATFDRGSHNTPEEVTAVLPQAGWSSAVRFRWIIPSASGRWAIDDVSISAFQSVLTYTGSNRVVYTSLLSQPQKAIYSRMIDTDTDVFPTYWLLNGVDNSIGARWLMRYRSSTDATAAWGQDTDFGAVTLGQPEIYTALDSSGVNTNFARFYFMYVTIDSSQAFGYPEDVSRGPTITDMTLFFTSDPSKRMRHGKTFTGGQLQPLDTPF